MNKLLGNKSFYIRISLLLVVIMFVFSSCSLFNFNKTLGDINTNININENGAGSRAMTCKLNMAGVESSVIGGKSALDDIVTSHCPQSINFVINDAGYDFTVSFSSIDDYKNKVANITGSTPEIAFGVPNSVFANGFKYSESFTSDDLLYWIYRYAYEGGLLKNDSPIWKYSDAEINCMGKSYSTTEPVEISDVYFVPLEKVSMLTTSLGNDKFSRTVSYAVSADTITYLGSTVNEYMNSLVPDNATAEWQDTSTGKVFNVTFDADGLSELLSKTNRCMNSNSGRINMVGENNNVLSNDNFSETVDLSSFPSSSSGTTKFLYSYVFNSDANDNSVFTTVNGEREDVSNLIKNKRIDIDNNCTNFVVEIYSNIKLDVSSVYVSQCQNSSSCEDDFSEVITIAFAGNDWQRQAELIKQYVDSFSNSETFAEVSDNSCIITINASLKRLNVINGAMFSQENKITANKNDGFTLFNKISFSESLALSEFLRKISYDGETRFSFSPYYNVKSAEISTTKEKTSLSCEKGKNAVMAIIPNGTNIRLNMESEKLNIPFVVSLLVAILVFIGIVILIIGLVVSKKKNNEIAMTLDEHNRANGVVTPNAKKSSTQKVKQKTFKLSKDKCKKCGAQLYEGMAFCTKCGKKIPMKEEPKEKPQQKEVVEEKQKKEKSDKLDAIVNEKISNPFISEKKACPNCGTILEDGQSECPKCKELSEQEKI